MLMGAGTLFVIAGLAAHFGPWDTLRDVQERVLGGGVDHPPVPKRTGWDHADGQALK